jgi:hypothetical protein
MNSLESQLEPLNAELRLAVATSVNEGVSEDARSEARARIGEITERIISLAKNGDSPVYIVNLTAKRWLLNRSYSTFWIRGCTEGEKFCSTRITGRRGKVDTGRGGETVAGQGWRVKLDNLYWPADQIAKDLCREINGDLPALQVPNSSNLQRGKIQKTMGCFVSYTSTPDPDVLAQEYENLKMYWALLVSEGDMIWRKTHDHRMISDLNREAVDGLGLSREWHESLTSIMSGGSKRRSA